MELDTKGLAGLVYFLGISNLYMYSARTTITGSRPNLFWSSTETRYQDWKVILLMEEILHQLIHSLSHYLQGLYIPGGAGFLPSTVSEPTLLFPWCWWMVLLHFYFNQVLDRLCSTPVDCIITAEINHWNLGISTIMVPKVRNLFHSLLPDLYGSVWGEIQQILSPPKNHGTLHVEMIHVGCDDPRFRC